MTVLEAIQANPVFSDISEETINFMLDSRSIDGAAVYNESSLKDVELVSADLYFAMAVMPEFKEGQLSVKYDASILKSRAKGIYTKYDDPKLEELKPQPINVGITSVDDLA